jgi:hypothetical protein
VGGVAEKSDKPERETEKEKITERTVRACPANTAETQFERFEMQWFEMR